MSYIQFDKNQLVNLEYSLNKELLRSNRAGSYASTTIIGCNTRKYHGLLITPLPHLDGENHVLLSSLDETVIQHDAEFNLGIRKYPGGVYIPKGHKYIRDFDTEPIPKLTYRVGGVVLTKEMVFAQKEDKIFIRYTLMEAHSPTTLRLRPFLAFRNVHKLSKANNDVYKKYDSINNGISVKMYAGYPDLCMQLSKNAEYTHVPDWYYSIEYQREMERGYDFSEDLYVPGFFDVPIEKGESVVFAAGLEESNPALIKRQFNAEIKKRIPRDSFEHCLLNSAQQFIVHRGKKTEVIAGFPWFGRWGRDTFIALPGLTLAEGDTKTCKAVLDTMIGDLKGPLFPNMGAGNDLAYNSVDAPLWFFWALQKYAEASNMQATIWNEYGKTIRLILEGLRNGTSYNIKLHDNALLFAGDQGVALSWMDAVVNGKPVTPRVGYAVEINALWYNAIMFSIESAEAVGDHEFLQEWIPVAERIPESFIKTFWDGRRNYLADFVNGDFKDWSVRPNQIFAVSLPYTALEESMQIAVMQKVKKELLTSRGLRTLSPKNPQYKAIYTGDQKQRDEAYHQGTVWPWLFGHYAEAFFKLYGKVALQHIEKYYKAFEGEINKHGIGSISEVYDGDPPHIAGGAISQAWSVAELLRVYKMISIYK